MVINKTSLSAIAAIGFAACVGTTQAAEGNKQVVLGTIVKVNGTTYTIQDFRGHTQDITISQDTLIWGTTSQLGTQVRAITESGKTTEIASLQE